MKILKTILAIIFYAGIILYLLMLIVSISAIDRLGGWNGRM